MVAGVTKVKGEQISIMSNDDVEQLITGSLTGATPTGWNLKVKGTYLHWVDNDGNERRKEGTLTGESRTAGSITVHGDYLYYGDNEGDERSLSAEPSVIIYAGSVEEATIVRLSDGSLCVIYQIGDTIYAKYSTDDGASWGDAEVIVTETTYFDIAGLDACVDSADNVHLVYVLRPVVTGYRQLYYTYRDSATGLWSDKEDIIGDVTNLSFPRIAVDSSDNLHCIYNQLIAGSASVAYVKRTSGVWGSPTTLATKASRYSAICQQDICVDSNDYVHVVYTGSNSAPYLHYRLWNGSWQDEETLAGSLNYRQYFPTLDVDLSNSLHVMWAGVGYGVAYPLFFQLCYITGNSGAWGSVIPLTDNTATTANITMAMTLNDDIHCCFNDSGTGNHIKYTGGAWSDIDVFSSVSTTVKDVVRKENLLATGYMVVFRGLNNYFRFLEGV